MKESFNNNADVKAFTNTIRRLRKENDLSKKEMAKLLKIGIGTLEKLEEGELPPKLGIQIVFTIYDKFGILPKEQFKIK